MVGRLLMSFAPQSPAKYKKPMAFGKVCGVAPGGIPAHSCDYDTVDPEE